VVFYCNYLSGILFNSKIITTATIAAFVFALGAMTLATTEMAVHAATYKQVDSGFGAFDKRGHWHCVWQYDSNGNSECV
jgi:hypothetical protein